jgi:hypothetical protein
MTWAIPESRKEAYLQYIASPAWQAKRIRVLQRAGGTCERCRKAPARQVHHLTYVRLFVERDEDLLSPRGVGISFPVARSSRQRSIVEGLTFSALAAEGDPTSATLASARSTASVQFVIGGLTAVMGIVIVYPSNTPNG